MRGLKRYKKQKGGQSTIGIDVNSISTFLPSSIPGLVLWIQPDEKYVRTTALRTYANQQAPLIRINLLDIYSSRLDMPVITEIQSAVPDLSNSLIRLEYADDISTTFPKLYSPKGAPPVLDLSSYQEDPAAEAVKITMITKEPIDLPPAYSTFLDAEGLSMVYNTTIDRFILSATELSRKAPTFEPGQTAQKPTAFLRELLVYSRELSLQEKQQVEGYLAFRNNHQSLLSQDHPYFPDVSDDPVVAPLLEPIAIPERDLRTLAVELTDGFAEFTKAAGTGDSLKGEYDAAKASISNSLNTFKQIRNLLSKGILLSRASVATGEYTLSDILNAIATPNLASEIATEKEKAGAAIAAGRALLPKFQTGAQIAAERQAILTAEEIAADRKDATTEEGLRNIEVATRRRDNTMKQLQTRQEIQRLGGTLLAPYKEEFISEVDLNKESFKFQTAARKTASRALESKAQAFRAPFQTGEWTEAFSFLDVSRRKDGTYVDAKLQLIYGNYMAIEAALDGNDMSYLANQLERIQTEVDMLSAHWLTIQSLPIFKMLYVYHLRQRFEHAEQLYAQWVKRVEELTKAIDAVNTDIETLKTYKELTTEPLKLTLNTFLPLRPIYFTSLSANDRSVFLGVSHVLSNDAGVPNLVLNANGEMDVQFFYPSQPKSSYSEESGYKGILQEFRQASSNAQQSILELMPPRRFVKPVSFELKGLSAPPLEIPRDSVNTLVRIGGTAETHHAVSLPKYAVKQNSFFCIQNTTPVAILVRNPGALEDSFDLVGPGEIGLFLYGEGNSLTSTPGFAYGTLDWIEGLYPYDTLLNSARSNCGVFVSELKTEIYCVPGLRGPSPLLDADGFFIPVVRAEDGNVYDMDDFSRSNPYNVRTIAETSLDALEYDRSTNSRRQVRVRDSNPLPTVRDAKTGLAILCSAPNVIAVDEFGYCKATTTPLVWNGEAAITKGSMGDIRCEPAKSVLEQPYRYPDGTLFQNLFRSYFCVEHASGSAVFSTAQEMLLLDASMNPILLPPNSSKQQGRYIYEEPAGQMNQTFLLETAGPNQYGTATQTPYVDIESKQKEIQMKSAARTTLFRIKTAVDYTKGAVPRLQAASQSLKELGDTLLESLREDISETIVLVEKKLVDLQSIEGTIERIQRLIQDENGTPIPADVSMSLSGLEMKVRDNLLAIQSIVDPIQRAIENFQFLLSRIKSLREFLARLRSSAKDAAAKGYETIQTLFRKFIQRTKSISSPELDAATADLKQLEMEFEKVQEELEKRAASHPEYMNELREWLLDLQSAAAQQYSRLQTIVSRGASLESKLAQADGAEGVAKKKELESLLAQIDSVRKDTKRIASLYETGRPASELVASTDQTARGPFLHLATPSLSVDIQPLLGDEATQPFIGLGPEVADAVKLLPILYAQDSEPLEPQIETAKTTLKDGQARLSELQRKIADAYQIYEEVATKRAEAQLKEIEELTGTLKEAAKTLESQRLAAETAAQSAPTSQEVQTALANLQEISGKFAPELGQVDTAERNPFRLAPIVDARRAAVEKGQTILNEMRDAIQQFQIILRGKGSS